MAAIRGSCLYSPQTAMTDITLAKNYAVDLGRWIRMWNTGGAVSEIITQPAESCPTQENIESGGVFQGEKTSKHPLKNHLLKWPKILQSSHIKKKKKINHKILARDFQSSFGRILGGSKLSLHQNSDNVSSSHYKKNIIWWTAFIWRLKSKFFIVPIDWGTKVKLKKCGKLLIIHSNKIKTELYLWEGAIPEAVGFKMVCGQPWVHSTSKRKNLTATSFIIRQEERLCY